jgi:uncharacterized membrane protein
MRVVRLPSSALLLLILVQLLQLPLGSGLLLAADVMTGDPSSAAYQQAVIQPLLAKECIRCHGPTRSKGYLRLDSRQAAIQGGGRGPAIVPCDPAHSLLITAVRYQDEDLQMPPDRRLSDAQITSLAMWIAAGAPWTDAAGHLQTGSPPSSAPAIAGPAGHPPAARAPLIGRFHPLVVHIPIACLLLCVLAEFLVATRGPAWEPCVRLLLVCGVLGAGAAVLTGTWFAPEGTLFHHQDPLLTQHEFLGWMTLIVSSASLALLLLGRRPRMRVLFRLLLLLTVGLVSLTGHLGGTMVYGEGWLF